MTSEPSWQDLYDAGLAALQSRRPRLIVNRGDVTDAILVACATMGSAVIAYAAARFRACFLDGATGADLTQLAHDRGVDRYEGSFAVGTVTFSRVSTGAGAGIIPAGTKVASRADATGQFSIFTTDIDCSFGALDLTKQVTCTCTKIGPQGNVSGGDGTTNSGPVNRILDNIFDSIITVNNPGINDRFAGGTDEETDEDLRDRVRGFFLTQARGTIAALIFGAKTVTGVARVSVRVDDAGVVTMYVADADGNGNQAMADAVKLAIDGTDTVSGWRDAADVVYVTYGVIYTQNVNLTLTVRTGVDVTALTTRVSQAVISRVGRLNPGETLYLDMIRAAAREVDKDNILNVVVNVPVVDLVPTTSQIIRTSVVTYS
jgi:uncharacterized phage protein gp47/JayE